MNLIIRKCSNKEIKRHSDVPFNPPEFSNDVDKELFYDKFQSILDLFVENVLSKYGSLDNFDDNDYYVSEDSFPDRTISFSVMTRKSLNPNLIWDAVHYITSLEESYRIFINVDVSYDNIYFIFIYAGEIVHNCPRHIARLLS